jgi:YggT family protein
MFIISNLFNALAEILDIAITIYIWIVVARAVISWIRVDPYNQIVQFIVKVTEPALSRVRSFLPAIGGVDLSPIVLFLGLSFAERFLVSTLKEIAFRLG